MLISVLLSGGTFEDVHNHGSCKLLNSMATAQVYNYFVCVSVRFVNGSLVYRERGLGVSLFRLLSEHHPNSMVMLDEQYRMNRYS
jgi:hypothetical protein